MNKLLNLLMGALAGVALLAPSTSYSISKNAVDTLGQQCKQNINTTVCQAYLTGLVDGYVKSKKKYTETMPAPNNEFMKRVYSSRVSSEHLDSIKPEPACLPDKVNKQALVRELTQTLANRSDIDSSLDTLLYSELHDRYAC